MKDIVSVNKKGFSMLEMLVCMILLSSITLLSLRRINNLDLDHYYFLNDYLSKQAEALTSNSEVPFKKGIYFNSMGRVNQARTIEFNKHKIIIHLGTGYVSIE